jgi:hypothetical protein
MWTAHMALISSTMPTHHQDCAYYPPIGGCLMSADIAIFSASLRAAPRQEYVRQVPVSPSFNVICIVRLGLSGACS